MKKSKKTENTSTVAIKVGAGLIAAGAVTAAGYYFYGSKAAKTHRKIAAKWATDMKREVMKEVEHIKDMNPRAFATIVDRVAKTYQEVRSSVGTEEVKRAAKELKANWDKVQRETKRTVRKTVVRAKKSVKKAVRQRTK